ncbi:hypothetical protein DESPIG_00327 [Desulfovibrio piger ATCC 29098]|uniref:Uncharacterized protein n=1 Tax=Desulfovibrio piger ATCC 29098 TaxID=411464 RepID=B6WQK3_9BACT|nr:hypothetical protein DESPIG_00327 [Desulfovibrio piger ATCC 29098]
MVRIWSEGRPFLPCSGEQQTGGAVTQLRFSGLLNKALAGRMKA